EERVRGEVAQPLAPRHQVRGECDGTGLGDEEPLVVAPAQVRLGPGLETVDLLTKGIDERQWQDVLEHDVPVAVELVALLGCERLRRRRRGPPLEPGVPGMQPEVGQSEPARAVQRPFGRKAPSRSSRRNGPAASPTVAYRYNAALKMPDSAPPAANSAPNPTTPTTTASATDTAATPAHTSAIGM